MKKEERESQIVRSPKSTNLFHRVPVLLPGTVSNRSLSLSLDLPFHQRLSFDSINSVVL